MPGRQVEIGVNYRYGFNGKENDNEVKGEGNEQDYGMRVYDPRLGRFLSLDPLSRSYPWYTPYQFAGDKPLRFLDRDGEEESDPFAKLINQPIRGKKGDNLAATVDFLGNFTVGFVYGAHEGQAYNFSKAVDGDLEFSNHGISAEATVTLKTESILYQEIFNEIKLIHHIDESDFTCDEQASLTSYNFKNGEDNSELFFFRVPKVQLAQDPVSMPIPATGPVVVVPPGASVGSSGSIFIDVRILAYEKANSSIVLSKVARSQEDYDKHVQSQLEGRERINKLQEQLSKTKKASKERIELQGKIKQEEELYKEHEKEIKQKWPNGNSDIEKRCNASAMG